MVIFSLGVLRNNVSWQVFCAVCSVITVGLCIVCLDEESSGNQQSTVAIVCTDFPRYFVAISRVRLTSCMVGMTGGSLKMDSSSVAPCAVFPGGSVKKETKVSLQVVTES